MRFNRPQPQRQCRWIIKEEEFMIGKESVFVGEQCKTTNPSQLLFCENCEEYYCLYHHWPHVDEGC